MKEDLNRIEEMLQGLDNLPIGEVKSGVKNLKMKFSEWGYVENLKIRISNIDDIELSDRQRQILNGEVTISYDEFQIIREEVGFWPFCEEILLREAKARRRFLDKEYDEDEGGPDYYPELELTDDLSKEEIIKIETIESLWNKLVVKSDPVNTILRICEQARWSFVDNGDYSYYGTEDHVMLFGEFLSKFPICTKSIEELYGQNQQREELQSTLYNEIVNGYRKKYDLKKNIDEDYRRKMYIIVNAITLYEKMLSDLVAGKTEVKSDVEVGGESPLSDKSLEELIEIATANDKTISQNDKAIKEALIQRILGQQQTIKEQEAEMQRLGVPKEK